MKYDRKSTDFVNPNSLIIDFSLNLIFFSNKTKTKNNLKNPTHVSKVNDFKVHVCLHV